MAINREKGLEGLPPYLTYSTWLKLLESLEQYLPPQFDRSYWDGLKFSGSTRTTARRTFLFLRLIGPNNEPTDKLQPLIQSRADQRRAELRATVERAYEPVIGSLDLTRATVGQLEERFRAHGAKGQLGDKCISFFLALARDAGIPLSPPLEAKSRVGRSPKTVVRRERGKRPRPEMSSEPPSAQRVSWTELLEELLLRDFPDFDPGWPEDVKIKWFVRELMDKVQRGKTK